MSTQKVVGSIENFCEEIACLKAFYCLVDEFTSRPIDKLQATAFINKSVRNVFATCDDINRVLVKLTIKPSELNAETVNHLITSRRFSGVRQQCLQLSTTAKQLVIAVLKIIKEEADDVISIPGEHSVGQLLELKRCVLMLPLIFKGERDVSLLQEQLIELPVCEEEIRKDIDVLLLETKDCLCETFCNLYLDNTCCHPALNEKNWQSLKSVIARIMTIVQS